MASAKPSRLTQLLIGISGIALGAGATAYFTGITEVETVRFRNQVVALSGTGQTSTNVAYQKHAVPTALVQTGGLLQADYLVMRWQFPETYTGVIVNAALDITTGDPDTFIDCYVVDGNSVPSGTGAGRKVFDNIAMNQRLISIATGGILIGPNEDVACLGTQGTGQLLVGNFTAEYRQYDQ